MNSADGPSGPLTPEEQKDAVAAAILAKRFEEALAAVQRALPAAPVDPDLLLLGSFAAVLAERPDASLRYQKRFVKNYRPLAEEVHLLRAVALAQQGHWFQAGQVLEQRGIDAGYVGAQYLPCGYAFIPWLRRWVARIRAENARRAAPAGPSKAAGPASARPAKGAPAAPARGAARAKGTAARHALPEPEAPADPAAGLPPLPAAAPRVDVSFSLPGAGDLALEGAAAAVPDAPVWFALRYDLARLALFEEYDELLCLPTLSGVDAYWYQIETVRKVLKQFRGRVLLADEVGLGKTVEAGMVLKEYMLRGMVDRVLVLTPASLVGQWLEEMESKFGLAFASTYDPLLRADPAAFWSQPRVVASIATARRADHLATLSGHAFDMVVVDEAHHLKNRATANWKLVDALRKRFLVLLSATPVQNNLVELYNLLTLLKPGIFKTEKEFRATYMTAGKPRVPANRDRMRDLMRDVMVRNTRALVDLRLPPRRAATLRVEPSDEEAARYAELGRLVQRLHAGAPGRNRMALRALLATAGSSPAAAASAVARFVDANDPGREWERLRDAYAAMPRGAKESALADLLRRNPGEKTMVFVHYRETLERLSALLEAEGVPFARFDGSMSGPEKDRAVERFRDALPVLLSTESGGEGRNMQFCHSLVNFDLPWNPMAIEQRIGRLHRIGQTREVFVFNLAVRGTIEDYVLQILDEKINMFELVVGEVGAILGEMEDREEFAERVLAAWVGSSEEARAEAFDELGRELVDARRQYEAARSLDEELFGDEFATE